MALQIRGGQLTGIKNASIAAVDANNDGIDLNKLNLSQTAAFTNNTASTSSSTGAITISGGIGISGDSHLGGDLSLQHDSAELHFGADDDVKLSHVADTGLLLNDGMELQFRDSGSKIYSSESGSLDLSATDVKIAGNLTVTGTTTYVNTTDLNVGDNQIILNADLGESDSPSEDAGIVIERGSQLNKSFIWDETNDKWTTGGDKLATGIVEASGNIQVLSGGSTKALLTATSGDLDLYSGDLTLSAGDITVSAGDITATVGTISAPTLSASTVLVSPSIKNASSGESFSVDSSGNVAAETITANGLTFDGTAGSASVGYFVPAGGASGQTAANFIANFDNDTSIPTSAMVQDYVDYKFENTSLSGDVTGDLTGDIKNDDSTLVLDNGSDTQGLYIYSADGSSLVLDAGLDGSDSYFEGDIRKQDGTVIVDFDEANGVYFQGQVSDITNHDISKLSDVDCDNLEAYDFLMYDGSSFVNVIEQVVFHTVDETTNSEVTNQAVVLSVASDDTFAEKSNVYLNGQKLRHGTSVQVGNGDREFYFDSANSKIHFSSSLIAEDDELEIRYLIDSDV